MVVKTVIAINKCDIGR